MPLFPHSRLEVHEDGLADAVVVRLDGVMAVGARREDEPAGAKGGDRVEGPREVEGGGLRDHLLRRWSPRDSHGLQEGARVGGEARGAIPERIVEARGDHGLVCGAVADELVDEEGVPLRLRPNPIDDALDGPLRNRRARPVREEPANERARVPFRKRIQAHPLDLLGQVSEERVGAS